MPKWTMVKAINNALAIKLEQDHDVLIFGEDVGKNGGVFRVTDGLQRKFGDDRVFDTPLAESAIIGSAVGMAAFGLRPIPEIQFAGFTYLAFHQIAAQVARMHFRSSGTVNMSMVIRAPFGGGVRTPELHADSVEALYMQVQGLKVIIPATPYDAKGLLISAIEDPDPVLFLEHMKLYRSFRQEVPAEHYTVPIGKAATVRKGSDISVVAYGAMVQSSLKAAEMVEQKLGASVEVIDLRTIAPLDEATIVNSVTKTGRAVVVQEGPRSGGVAAEIVAVINEQALYSLYKPVLRVTSPDGPYPFTVMEDDILPSPERIAAAIETTLEP